MQIPEIAYKELRPPFDSPSCRVSAADRMDRDDQMGGYGENREHS